MARPRTSKSITVGSPGLRARASLTDLMRSIGRDRTDHRASVPRVVVVDGRRVFGEALVVFLGRRGMDARLATSGDRAVAAAIRFRPHVIAVDGAMDAAVAGGTSLGQTLRLAVPEAAVLVTSPPGVRASPRNPKAAAPRRGMGAMPTADQLPRFDLSNGCVFEHQVRRAAGRIGNP